MAGQLYIPVRDQVSQGDLYRNFPSIFLEQRPLKAARPFKPGAARDIYGVHNEDGTHQLPTGGFKWRLDQSGEDILAHAHLGMAMVLSHDCEIDWDDGHRILAMVRPISDLQKDDQQKVFDLKVYSAFPLPEHSEAPQMKRSFIDFRRLTTVRPAVLEASERFASASDELRKAVAERFRLYLFRRLKEDRTAG